MKKAVLKAQGMLSRHIVLIQHLFIGLLRTDPVSESIRTRETVNLSF